MTRVEPTASPILRMEGVSKRYGGVRALANADLVVVRGSHSRHSRRERRGQVDVDQDPVRRRRAGRRTHRARRGGSRLRFSRRGQPRRHCLHLPGAFARSRPFGRRQHRNLQSAAPLRADRPARAATPRRGSARARRRARHSSDGAGQGSAAVAPADGGDRQGAGPQAARSHSRRGDFGADGGRRRQGVRRPQAPAPGGAGAPVHFAPHARDRGARRREHRVQERRQCRDLCGRNEDRQRGRRNDDRTRVQPHFSAEAGGAGKGRGAAVRGPEPQLGGPSARHFVHRRSGRSRRPRRSRRAGPARIAAGFVRRPARRIGRDPGGRRRPCPLRARTRRRGSGSAWRSFPRIARRKG